MAGPSGFWAKVTDEVRTVSDRTRRGAKRAVQIGVIRVDLISLRRDRSQALASLGDEEELARRRRANAAALTRLEEILRSHGLDPAGPAVGNFLYAEVGEDSVPLFESLLRLGVIVRPLRGFGAPGAIRVTVGTDEDLDVLDAALGRVLGQAA